MVYLGILVVVAVAGLLRLWLQQRRERRNVEDLEAVTSSLRRLADRPPVGSSGPPQRTDASRGAGHRSGRVIPEPGPIAPLEGARREAARRRIEERRAARRRVG